MKNTKLAAVFCASVISLSSAALLTESVSAEWIEKDKTYSYTDKSGKKVTGWQEIDGGKYYFDKSGVAQTGFQKIDGKTYYFLASKKGKMATGWATVGGSRYYFGKDGVMRTGKKKISGQTYEFDKDGKMISSLMSWKYTKEDVLKKYNEDSALDFGSLIMANDSETSGTFYLFDDEKGTLLMYLKTDSKYNEKSISGLLDAEGYKSKGDIEIEGTKLAMFKGPQGYAAVTEYNKSPAILFLSPDLGKIYEKSGVNGLMEVLSKKMSGVMSALGFDESYFKTFDEDDFDI